MMRATGIGFRWFKDMTVQRHFGKYKEAIEQVLRESYEPVLFECSDESAKHREATDSHFSVYMVSDKFAGMALIKRHKGIKGLLKEKGIMDQIHALSIVSRTVEEHNLATHGNLDPKCLGGEKKAK